MRIRINTFFYSVRQGIKNIWRNKMFSLASIATMAACIFMFGLFYVIVVNFNVAVRGIEEGVAVTVFFDEGLSEDEILAIGDKIRDRIEVSACEYTSAEEAWEKYQEIYFKDHEELASGFANDNPLANSASIAIYLNDVSMQPSLVKYLKTLKGVRQVNQSEAVASTLTDFNRLISYVSAGIILILLCVAVFLISNTVSVGISVRSEEIGIMKLIGATDYLVRAPFVVEGIIIGLVGAAIPLVLLYFMYDKIIEYVSDQFGFLSSLVEFVATRELFETLVPVALLLGVGIGFSGSVVTVRKHLKV